MMRVKVKFSWSFLVCGTASVIASRPYSVDDEDSQMVRNINEFVQHPVRFENLTHLTLWEDYIGQDTLLCIIFCSEKLVHLCIRFGQLISFDNNQFVEAVSGRRYRSGH